MSTAESGLSGMELGHRRHFGAVAEGENTRFQKGAEDLGQGDGPKVLYTLYVCRRLGDRVDPVSHSIGLVKSL
jgi:hypothetical protein